MKLLLFSGALIAAVWAADPAVLSNGTIASRVENGIQTECKTCPYSLCTNKAAYDYGANMTLTCWTEGTSINNDTTWLKTTDGCYVTQWDIIEYSGDYTEDLPYCGRIREHYTTTPGRTKYNAECNLIPRLSAEHIKMYKPNSDITLTCVAEEEEPTVDGTALDDGIWYKTTSNCYITQNLLFPVRGKKNIDKCGPIPFFMELKMRDPDPPEADDPVLDIPSTETVPDQANSESAPGVVTEEPAPGGVTEPESPSEGLALREAVEKLSEDIARRAAMFLYETYVGEENATCYAKPDNRTRVIRVYDYNETVTPQCGERDEAGDIWLYTIHWCWVQDALMDPNLIDSVLRSESFPHCEYFVDGGDESRFGTWG